MGRRKTETHLKMGLCVSLINLKTLVMHAENFSYTPIAKEIKSAEETTTETKSFGRCVVCFTAIEEEDENKQELAERFVEQIKLALKEVGENTLILYPFVHLTDKPAKPSVALCIIKTLKERVSASGVHVESAPFGWNKKFSITIFGHPLAERSFRF